MRLIGMLDSPYVRRVAISLDMLGIPFEHESVSVFSTFGQFRAINPVVKAPTLVCDDGTLLMDSTLILDYAETLASGRRSLMPTSVDERRHALSVLGLALAACEKAVQLVYERNLRPAELHFEPWLSRVGSQLGFALRGLESAAASRALMSSDGQMGQAGITTAVAWRFIEDMVPDRARASEHPTLAKLSERAELLRVFVAYPPDGPGVVANGLQ